MNSSFTSTFFTMIAMPGWLNNHFFRQQRMNVRCGSTTVLMASKYDFCFTPDSVVKLFGSRLQGFVLSSGGSLVALPVVASIDAINA